jgi:hypothetical protein
MSITDSCRLTTPLPPSLPPASTNPQQTGTAARAEVSAFFNKKVFVMASLRSLEHATGRDFTKVIADVADAKALRELAPFLTQLSTECGAYYARNNQAMWAGKAVKLCEQVLADSEAVSVLSETETKTINQLFWRKLGINSGIKKDLQRVIAAPLQRDLSQLLIGLASSMNQSEVERIRRGWQAYKEKEMRWVAGSLFLLKFNLVTGSRDLETSLHVAGKTIDAAWSEQVGTALDATQVETLIPIARGLLARINAYLNLPSAQPNTHTWTHSVLAVVGTWFASLAPLPERVTCNDPGNGRVFYWEKMGLNLSLLAAAKIKMDLDLTRLMIQLPQCATTAELNAIKENWARLKLQHPEWKESPPQVDEDDSFTRGIVTTTAALIASATPSHASSAAATTAAAASGTPFTK